ncbi:hypothetical protein PAXRUDRAFT_832366 [Paxillus rubicundulus Ve08.2h10]|uniref:Uncharacterized protein n=1 Tax=Paxillus rubicundulus Ve08.2h10 TaxID=930991 RepID=A0A0D0D271_9AGAM|nr:hypothetical protein PAXRUDRAFT_832366 [Paxillus rubicundulus Ve08.2h10]
MHGDCTKVYRDPKAPWMDKENAPDLQRVSMLCCMKLKTRSTRPKPNMYKERRWPGSMDTTRFLIRLTRDHVATVGISVLQDSINNATSSEHAFFSPSRMCISHTRAVVEWRRTDHELSSRCIDLAGIEFSKSFGVCPRASVSP